MPWWQKVLELVGVAIHPHPIPDGTWVVGVRTEPLPIHESGQLPDDLAVVEGMLVRREDKTYVRTRSNGGYSDTECSENAVAPRSDSSLSPEDLAWLNEQRPFLAPIYIVRGKHGERDYQAHLCSSLNQGPSQLPNTTTVYDPDPISVVERAKSQIKDHARHHFIVVDRQLPGNDIYVT